jgi:hypothetical protein
LRTPAARQRVGVQGDVDNGQQEEDKDMEQGHCGAGRCSMRWCVSSKRRRARLVASRMRLRGIQYRRKVLDGKRHGRGGVVVLQRVRAGAYRELRLVSVQTLEAPTFGTRESRSTSAVMVRRSTWSTAVGGRQGGCVSACERAGCLGNSRGRRGDPEQPGVQKLNEPHFPPSSSLIQKNSRKKVNIKDVEGTTSFTGEFSESKTVAKRWRKRSPKSRKKILLRRS